MRVKTAIKYTENKFQNDRIPSLLVIGLHVNRSNPANKRQRLFAVYKILILDPNTQTD